MQPAGESGRPTIVISGSLAFDYIMTYPGSFQDHIIPDKTHVLSVSFLFDSLRQVPGRRRRKYCLQLRAARRAPGARRRGRV